MWVSTKAVFDHFCVCVHGWECVHGNGCFVSFTRLLMFTLLLFPSLFHCVCIPAAPVNKTTWWTLPDRPARVTTTAARGGHCNSVPESTKKGFAVWPANHTSTRHAHPVSPDNISPCRVPSTSRFQSALDFPHPSLPTLWHKHRPSDQFTPANQGLPYHMGRREWNSEERSEAAILFAFFPWTVWVSSCFLIVAVVPLIPVPTSIWLTSLSLPLPLLILLFLPHCEIER